MAISPGNDNGKAADRARVLLTLAGQSDEAAGPCLSAAEMASLLEGKANAGRDLMALRAHLGGCPSCYGEWLLVQKTLAPVASRGRRYRLRRWTRWPYLGTALAAAASLMVYLNVVRMEETTLQHTVSPVIVGQGKERALPQALPPPEQEARQVAAEPTTAPPAAVSTKGKTEDRQAAPRKSMEDVEEVRQRQTVLPPAPAAPAPLEKKIAGQGAEPLAEMEAVPPRSPAGENMQRWLAELKDGCLAGRSDHQFWVELLRRGRELPVTTGAEKARMAAILALLPEGDGPEMVAEQCRLVLAELAKEDGSR